MDNNANNKYSKDNIDRLYEKDRERAEKKIKRKKKKRKLVILLVIVILVGVAVILEYMGFMPQFKVIRGRLYSYMESSSAVQTQTDVTAKIHQIKEFNIKVSGSTYIYNSVEIDLNVFLGIVKKSDNAVVNIEYDNATAYSSESLEEALDKNNISWTVVSRTENEVSQYEELGDDHEG